MTAAGAWIVYDGECPFCSRYVAMLRLRETLGSIALVNARDGGPEVEEARAAGLDLDEGMVLKFDGRLYHGDDCIHRLALLSTPSGAFNRVNAAPHGAERGAAPARATAPRRCWRRPRGVIRTAGDRLHSRPIPFLYPPRCLCAIILATDRLCGTVRRAAIGPNRFRTLRRTRSGSVGKTVPCTGPVRTRSPLESGCSFVSARGRRTCPRHIMALKPACGEVPSQLARVSIARPGNERIPRGLRFRALERARR